MSKFFLYNGVELPELPEWDKTRYPYAFIYIVTLDGTTGVYTLVVSSSSVMGYDGNGIICPSATVGQRYTVSGEEWAAAASSDDFYIKRDNLIFTVWANFDVLNANGSVYVAASEPVPVAGKFPLREWVGWLLPGLCSRAVPVVETREPVAYLYNGVRLPPLPELVYPHAYIAKSLLGGTLLFITDTPLNATYIPAEETSSGVDYEYGMNSNGVAVNILQYNYNNNTGQWDYKGESNRVFSQVHEPLWANTDMEKYYYRGDDVYEATGIIGFEASDPIPVYE